jgi:5-methylcytosine-specific restriction endonuclease McrA
MIRRTIQDGEKFGKWTVLDFNKIKKKYKIQCDCGNIRYYAKHAFDGTGKKTIEGCFDCIQKKSRPHVQLPNDLSIKRKIYDNYKRAAKKRNYEFSLDEETFFNLIFKDCFYCGSGLSMTVYERRFAKRSVDYNGIDRVDNTIGYTKDNCVSCCKICNNAKSTLSIDEFDNWIKKLYNFRISTK